MDKADVQRRYTSTFYDVSTDAEIPVRRLTDTGTLYTDVGQSKFFDENAHRHTAGSLHRTRSLTGTTVIQAGSSQFFTKPSLSELACMPPQMISANTENMPVRKLVKSGTVKFPQLKEFAHFHYTKVTIGNIQTYIDKAKEVVLGAYYDVMVLSNGVTWVVQRNSEHFKLLDKQLHYCVFDRKYSNLPLLATELTSVNQEETTSIISDYLEKFSLLTGNSINCGTILNFFELNSSGGRFISPATDSAINIPAIAAAMVTKAYQAKDYDELELKVGDLISVIDKPPAHESSWWRGKKELLVGFFPSECVEVIGNRRSSSSVSSQSVSEDEKLPVLRKRDKVIAFLRQFFLHRPARSQLKQSGIVKERVFGTDLGEYLTNSALLFPTILTRCCEAIEQHGIIDGIYRLSGRAVLVQKLREDFDLDRHETFNDEEIIDIHAISTLLKTYFRELPNPLLTYQLYDSMVSCVQLRQAAKKVTALKSHVASLPPTHYRTARYLFAHLSRLSKCNKRTSMNTRNLAIVWAPNLMRYEDTTGQLNAFVQLQNVSLQAAVMELLIANFDQIFPDQNEQQPNLLDSVKPQVLTTNSRLLSLSMARRRNKKGRITPKSNSSCEYPVMLGPTLSNIEESTDVVCGLKRSQSVSLDSVFISSTSKGDSSVHLLTGLEVSGQRSANSDASYQDIDTVFRGKRKTPNSPRYPTSVISEDSGTAGGNSHLDDHVHPTAEINGNKPEITTQASVYVKPLPVPKPRTPKPKHEYVNMSNIDGKLVLLDKGAPVRKPSVKPPIKPKPSHRLHSPQASRNNLLDESKIQSRCHSVPVSSVPDIITSMQQRDPECKSLCNPDPTLDAADRQSHYAVWKINYTNERTTASGSNSVYGINSMQGSDSTQGTDSALCGTPIMPDSETSAYCDRDKCISLALNVNLTAEDNIRHSAGGGRRSKHRSTLNDYDNVVVTPTEGRYTVGDYENVSIPMRNSVSSQEEATTPVISERHFSVTNPTSADDDVVLRHSGRSSMSNDTLGSTDYEDGW